MGKGVGGYLKVLSGLGRAEADGGGGGGLMTIPGIG